MLKKKRISLVLIILLSVSISFTAAAQDVKRTPRLNFNGITGDDFIGQAGVFYPFRNTENSLWFTDFRYRISEDDVDEWNLGLGYRYKLDNVDNHIAGIYAYKDRREEYDHYWDMWTIGGEILTDEWDFRLNGYITEDEKVLAPFSTGSTSAYVNNSGRIVISPGKEVYYKSMNGLDLEIGKRFTETETIFKDIGIYAKLFRFFESDTPTLTGRQIRIDKQFGDRDKTTWKIGAQWRDDNIRGSETEATFAVSIPFGKGNTDDREAAASSPEILEARMTEKPERDLDIVVGESVSKNSLISEEEELTAYDSLGNELGRVWYVTAVDNDNTEGTKDKPIDIDYLINEVLNEVHITDISMTLRPSLETQESNDVIVLLGGENDFDLGSYYLDLKYGQKLLSTGYGELDVQSDNGTIQTTFKEDGERANIIGDSSLVRVNGNNTVSGFAMGNSEYNSIIGSGSSLKGNLDINNNIFSTYEETSNNSIGDINISSGGGAPYISISSESTEELNIKIEDNIFDGINLRNSKGIEIQNSNNDNTNITISGNTINYFGSGIYIKYLDTENLAQISNNEINNSIFGIYFYDIAGDGNEEKNEEKLENLASFNKLYENENKINDLNVDVAVFDHIINDWYDLFFVNDNPSSVYLMKSNLNSESRGYEQFASSSAFEIMDGSGWIPIGGLSGEFNGLFDGNDKSIGNLVINRPTADYIGLFSSISNGTVIRNLGLENADITGDQYVGALVGLNKGTIENSYTTGYINGQNRVGGISGDNTGNIDNSYSESTVEADGDYIGGLSGHNNRGSISNSYATGIVKGNESVGGLVGYSYMGNINDSYAEGKVEGFSGVGGLLGENHTGNITGSYALGDVYSDSYGAGGLVGYNTDGNITKSYAEGNVDSGGYNVGGLVGNSYGGSISNSYATGSVHGYDSVGGLVGSIGNSGSIEKSYSIGLVIAVNTAHVGGLVGYNISGIVDFENYWNFETSGQSASDGGTDLSTAEMKDSTNYVGWDFDTIWDIDQSINNGYPFLQ